MKKKRNIIIATIVIGILMLIPIPIKLKDGGSVEYKAILFKYTKIHRLSEKSSTGYEDGWELKILGIHITGMTHWNIENLITIEELENINKTISDRLAKYLSNNEYNNFASNYVDTEKHRIIIELVDNSEKEQQWFRDNIYDSKYIEFEQGGPYITLESQIEVVKSSVQNKNKFNIYLERDNRVIYLSSYLDEVYYYDNTKMTLKDYITDTNQSMDNSIKSLTDLMNNTGTLKDGGTNIYKSKNYDFTIITCNTISGNKDIFIGDYNMSFNDDIMCHR